MSEDLRVKVEEFADRTLEKWVDHGETLTTSWVSARPWTNALGVSWQGGFKVLRSIKRRKPHLLRQLKLTQGGQQRRVLQLRLDGVPRYLLGINIARVAAQNPEAARFIEAVQDDFYEVLVEKFYGTGAGDDAIRRAKMRLGNRGVTMPLFPETTEPVREDRTADVIEDERPVLLDPASPYLTAEDREALDAAEAFRRNGGYGELLDADEVVSDDAMVEPTTDHDAARTLEALTRGHQIGGQDLTNMLMDAITARFDTIMAVLREIGLSVEQLGVDLTTSGIREGYRAATSELSRIADQVARQGELQKILIMLLQLATATGPERERLARKLRGLTVRRKAPRPVDPNQLGWAW